MVEVTNNLMQMLRRCFSSSRALCESFALAGGHEALLDLSLLPTSQQQQQAQGSMLKPLALLALTGI